MLQRAAELFDVIRGAGVRAIAPVRVNVFTAAVGILALARFCHDLGNGFLRAHAVNFADHFAIFIHDYRFIVRIGFCCFRFYLHFGNRAAGQHVLGRPHKREFAQDW